MSDPLSISASVAGLVSLGLQVSKGLIQYYESWKDSQKNVTTMFESLEALFKTLKLLNERILVSPISKESVDLFTESVISCAGTIQRLDEKLKKAQSTKPGVSASIRKAQYPFREKTLTKMHCIVSDLRSNLSLALDALHIETTINSLQEVKHLNGKVDVLVKHSADGECLEALKWLTPLEFQSKQSASLRRRQPGSGKWLLENHTFQSWMNGDPKVLWCPGMPGAGKTILSSIVIDYLRTNFVRESVGIAYVYCVYNEASQTAENLLGSLLQQLAQQNTSVVDEVVSLKRRCTENDMPIALSDISAVLSAAIQNLQETYIVVDALDECSEDGGARRDFTLQLLRYLPNIRLLVTSRDIQAIQATLKPDFRVDVRANVEEVRSFVTTQTNLQPRLASMLTDDGMTRKAIVDTVTEKANGMWLLAALHMDSLAQEDNIRDLKVNLQNLPEGIDATYDELMRKIKKQGLRPAARAEEMLTLINCAFRPLSVQEVLCALTVRQDDTFFDTDGTPKTEDLLSVCCGLVILEEETQVLRLVHYTAEAYFKRRRQFQDAEAHERVTSILLTYINCLICNVHDCDSRLFDFSSGLGSSKVVQVTQDDEGIKAFALCVYAIDIWSWHARRAFEYQRPNDETRKRIDQQRGRKRSGWDVESCLRNLHRNGVEMPYDGRYPYHILLCDSHPNKIHLVSKFAACESKLQKQVDRSQRLTKLITKNLFGLGRLSEGFIYVCQPHGNIGLIKIGRTTRRVHERLKQWMRHCAHEARLEYPKAHQMYLLPHIRQLEALVHAELWDSRRIELKCAKCGWQHYEWFETTTQTAIEAIEKWSKWLQKEPHEKRKSIDGEKWSLKEEHRRNLPALLKPLQIPEQLQASPTLPITHPDTWSSFPALQQLGPHTLLFKKGKDTSSDQHVVAS